MAGEKGVSGESAEVLELARLLTVLRRWGPIVLILLLGSGNFVQGLRGLTLEQQLQQYQAALIGPPPPPVESSCDDLEDCRESLRALESTISRHMRQEHP